jgi:hypothetical protein
MNGMTAHVFIFNKCYYVRAMPLLSYSQLTYELVSLHIPSTNLFHIFRDISPLLALKYSTLDREDSQK